MAVRDYEYGVQSSPYSDEDCLIERVLMAKFQVSWLWRFLTDHIV